MDETCEVNTAPMATGRDDPRTGPCGRPARFHEHDTWICADHWDAYVAASSDTDSFDLEE